MKLDKIAAVSFRIWQTGRGIWKNLLRKTAVASNRASHCALQLGC